MARTTHKELLDAGVHFGHLKRKRNPNMAPYIFMERNGIHIIDLNKTVEKIEAAANALKQIAKSGRKVLFVATKKQAKNIVADLIKTVNMPYATERWPGGMLTNFHTIRKAVKKMDTIDKMATDGTYDNISKKERLQIQRQREKLEKNLGSVADLKRLPAALFVVDMLKEKIAVAEAQRLNIPIFAMVDTNSDPTPADFIIPSNDDSSKSISLIIGIMTKAITEGLEERNKEKADQDSDTKSKSAETTEKDTQSKDDAKTLESTEDTKSSKDTGGKKVAKSGAKAIDGKTKGKRKRTTSKNSNPEEVKTAKATA
jgi:small subunit ribosomal protein S2